MAKLSSTSIYGNLYVDGEIMNKATTSTEGVVQLSNSYAGTSEVKGVTEKALKDGLATKLSTTGGTLSGPLQMAAQNLYFNASDPGDIIWQNGSSTQVSRIWAGGSGVLSISGNGTTTNPVQVDTNNNLVINGTLKHGSKNVVSGDSANINIGNSGNLLKLHSNATPKVSVGGTEYTMYHSGNLSELNVDNLNVKLIKGHAASIGTEDWNTLIGNKFYNIVNASGSNRPTTTVNGGTVSAYGYGYLLGLQHTNATNQLYLSHNNSEMWIRGGYNGAGWNKWAKVYTTEHKPHWADITGKPGDFTPASHKHGYDVDDPWLRDYGDNANVKLYGNTRQMAFRTDGITEYASGVGAYPFAFMYGGDAATNRLMLVDNGGDLWLKKTGAWLSASLNGKANSSHNHTSLTDVTSIAFKAESTDAASISTTIDGTNTYFNFNLADDLGQNDQWRWRFSNTNMMVLNPISTGKAELTVNGEIYANGNKVYHDGNKPSTVGNTVICNPCYNWENGILIDFNVAAQTSTMVSVRLTGNGYSTGQNIESTYHFYDYGDGGMIQCHGIATGLPITLSVFRHGGKLKGWLKQTSSYQTLILEVTFGNDKTTSTPTLSNAAIPTSGVTEKVDIVPKTVYHTGRKPSASDLGVLSTNGGTLTGNLNFAPSNGLSVIDFQCTGSNNDRGWIKHQNSATTANMQFCVSDDPDSGDDSFTFGAATSNLSNLDATMTEWVKFNRLGIYYRGNAVYHTGNFNADSKLNKDNGTIGGDGVYNNGWYRSYGEAGWYSQDYGGGWHMKDSTWIRAYNGKSIYTSSTIQGNNLVSEGKATFGGFASTVWSNAQLELKSEGVGATRLTFHRPSQSQMSIVHHTKDQLHVHLDNGTERRLLTTGDSCAKNWNWSGQGGQPPWLWGGTDGTNMYVYNPSNFSVNYANSAGKWGDRQCWWGAVGSRPGNGYIQFCW